jgi:ADP-heptose:LPS heptosyltransferase
VHKSMNNELLFNGTETRWASYQEFVKAARSGQAQRKLGIHIGSGIEQAHKRWSPSKWIELLTLLQRSFSGTILMIWGPGEEQLYKEFERQCRFPNVKHLVRAPFDQVLNQIQSCQWFLSNDSGIAHIVSLFQIPQLVLFGPYDPDITGPLNPRAMILKVGPDIDQLDVAGVHHSVLQLVAQ